MKCSRVRTGVWGQGNAVSQEETTQRLFSTARRFSGSPFAKVTLRPLGSASPPTYSWSRTRPASATPVSRCRSTATKSSAFSEILHLYAPCRELKAYSTMSVETVEQAGRGRYYERKERRKVQLQIRAVLSSVGDAVKRDAWTCLAVRRPIGQVAICKAAL